MRHPPGIHRKQTEDWKVSVIDTGRSSSVADRLYMAGEYSGNETVLVTYGDCLSDIDIRKMTEQHKAHGDIATFAVAHPTGRNEILALSENGKYQGIMDRASAGEAWVNACSMVLEPEAIPYFAPDSPTRAATLMECLAQEKAAAAFLEYILSDEAKPVFEQYNYGVLE